MTTMFDDSDSPMLFDYGLKGKQAGNINIAPFLALIPSAAEPLRAVLESASVQEVVAHYNEQNSRANHLQARHLRLRKIGYWAAFVATAIGVLFLFPFMQWLDQANAKIALLLIEALCIGLIWWSRKNSSGLQEIYFETRYSAEANRLNLFVRAINGAAGDALRPALDFVVHYLVVDQYAFYLRRGEAHEKKAETAARWRKRANLVYKILFLFSLPAFLLLAANQGWLLWPWLSDMMTQHSWLLDMANRADSALAGMGVMVSAIHSLTVSLTRLELSERNTATYAEMAKDLKQALAGLDGLQDQALRGDKKALCTFVDGMIKKLRNEQEEWRQLQKVVLMEYGAE